MQRATRWFLGLPELMPEAEEQTFLVTSVKFESLAQQQLLHRMDARGRWSGGALFGSLHGGTLTVALISMLGPPEPHSHPLTPSLPFLIGASQHLGTLIGSGVDWAGQWIAAPTGRLPERRADLQWLKLGARRGLFDERHPLVVVGLQEGYLAGRAYIWDEGESVEVDCLLGPLAG